MTAIGNFTDEAMEWTHEGIGGTINPGEVVEFAEGRANFILNAMGRRGLVRMGYSEEPGYKEAQIERSRKLNQDFWELQVEKFNQHNESLKASNKPYIRPPKHIKDAAVKLGIPLLGPWQIKIEDKKPAESNAEVQTLKSEINSLKEMLSSLASSVSNLVKSGVSAQAADPNQDVVDWTGVISTFKSKPKKQLIPWIKENKDLIPDWPGDVLSALCQRYEDLIGAPLDLDNLEKLE